jgi:hypothetical protein
VEQRAILLNGGRDLEVTLVPGAGEFLSRLLGAASSKPVAPSLRLVDNAPGQRSVGVFIGTRQVGFLAQADDQDLIATLRACQLNGAVARARGSLLASLEDPGKITVKVNLADTDRLLGDPEGGLAGDVSAGPPPGTTTRPAIEPVAGHTYQLEDGPLENTAAPELSAGYTEDYPDWPPQNPKAAAAESLGTGGFARPAPDITSEAPANLEARTSRPSPETLLSTRSAWMGAVPVPAQAPQAGWLTSSRPIEQAPQTEQTGTFPEGAQQTAAAQAGWPGMSEQGGTEVQTTGTQGQTLGVGIAASGMAPPPSSGSESWQDYAESAGVSGEPPVTGWTTGASVTPSASKAAPTGMSNKTKAWIASILVVAVLAGAGFALWKTFLASKTYTDPEYGYSFSYPGRWDFENDFGQFFPIDGMPGMGVTLDAAMAGRGDDYSLDDFEAVGVCVFDMSGLGTMGLGPAPDWSLFAVQMQQEFDQTAMMDPTLAIVEPFAVTSVGGAQGCEATMTIDVGFASITMTYCLLLDGEMGYVLMAMASTSNWESSQKTFDRFFASFKPGGARL